MSKKEMQLIMFRDLMDIMELLKGKLDSKVEKRIVELLREIKNIYSAFNASDKFDLINLLNKKKDEEEFSLMLSVLRPIMLDESYVALLEELTPYLKRRSGAKEENKFPSYYSVEDLKNFVKQKVEGLSLETIEALQSRAAESFRTGRNVDGKEITINHVLTLASILYEVKEKLIAAQKEKEEAELDRELQENLL